MFSSKYYEGNQIGKGRRPYRISHPEDNKHAMATLCSVLHSPDLKARKFPDTEAVIKLALLVDKYDCAKATENYGRKMLNKLPPTPLSSSLV